MLTTVDAKLRDIDSLSVSHDGAWVAFQIRRADAHQNRFVTTWHVAPTHGPGTPRPVAHAGQPIQPASLGRVNGAIVQPVPIWSADDNWLAYLRQDSGSVQIWRSACDGRRTEQLTRNRGDVRAFVYSRDGRRLLFETEPSRAQVEAALASEGAGGFLYDRRFFPAYERLPVMPSDASFAPGASSEVLARTRRVWAYD